MIDSLPFIFFFIHFFIFLNYKLLFVNYTFLNYCSNHFFFQILIPKESGLMGKRVKVIVKSAKKHCLIAEIVKRPTNFNDKLQGINSFYSLWPIFVLICVLARLIWLLMQ